METKTHFFKSYKLIILLYCYFLTIISCEKYVEVDFPNSQQTSTEVFEDNITATAALTNIYAELRDNVLITGDAQGLSNLIGLYADELTYYSINMLFTEFFYTNSLISTNVEISTIWSSSYNLIYQSNAVIEGVTDSETISLEDKNQLIGEAKFVRSLIYFYLVNLFGDIPYITTTDYNENINVERMSSQLVYNNIISDLVESKELLGTNYITSERIRPNKFTVSSLLSRVYLYSEDWENAEMESSFVINNGPYNLNMDIDEVFKNNSSETIWQLYPQTQGVRTKEAGTFIFTMAPPPNVALSTELISSFENGDNRLNSWIGNVSDGTNTFYYAYKYKISEAPSDEYSIIFRLAEQYLIRAEARIRLNNITGSQEDINKIRSRANLPNTTASNESDLTDVLVAERRSELFTEHGHRFFDLKRWDLENAALGFKPGWDSTDVLLPIPESEILLNENLTQNPGY
ncbi:RagB/SusD family nutrient uptake outer membrane protein [Gelidibacter japonicus]|uniref:RagB/SusD family nutrient uptake outer membrane protein n=1 Tax=Gelidibacter japonicus TaxID=1962232 RepID=UPI0013D43207|nr:RagB/SusD family nutrient uptake outer membrane protein [Gelidibacter japonicus]